MYSVMYLELHCKRHIYPKRRYKTSFSLHNTYGQSRSFHRTAPRRATRRHESGFIEFNTLHSATQRLMEFSTTNLKPMQTVVKENCYFDSSQKR